MERRCLSLRKPRLFAAQSAVMARHHVRSCSPLHCLPVCHPLPSLLPKGVKEEGRRGCGVSSFRPLSNVKVLALAANFSSTISHHRQPLPDVPRPRWVGWGGLAPWRPHLGVSGEVRCLCTRSPGVNSSFVRHPVSVVKVGEV